jgi:motility quorum-sensing regulator/GCU-specific mRNA interferase toxin
MEKNTPHRKLAVVKNFIATGHVRATGSAYDGARQLGIENLDGMCAVVLALTMSNFYKSMTTYADNHIWQDVYHAQAPNGQGVYLKLTVVDDVLIVSFKEL